MHESRLLRMSCFRNRRLYLYPGCRPAYSYRLVRPMGKNISFSKKICIFFQSCPYTVKNDWDTDLVKEAVMARGQRKTIEEKIQAKQELIEALMTRMESEKRELEELYQAKRQKELEAVGDLISDAGLEPDEVEEALRMYLESRAEEAS